MFNSGRIAWGSLKSACCCTCCCCARDSPHGAEGSVENQGIQVERTRSRDELDASSSEIPSSKISNATSASGQFGSLSIILVILALAVCVWTFVWRLTPLSLHVDVPGRTASLLKSVQDTSMSSILALDEIQDRTTLCDVIGPAVSAPFLFLFRAVSDVTDPMHCIANITSRVLDTEKTTDINSAASIIFLLLPCLCVGVFFIGFLAARLIRGKLKKSVCLSWVRSAMLGLILSGFAVIFAVTGVIQSLAGLVPLLRVEVQVNAAARMALLANFLLLLAWVESLVSQYVPLHTQPRPCSRTNKDNSL